MSASHKTPVPAIRVRTRPMATLAAVSSATASVVRHRMRPQTGGPLAALDVKVTWRSIDSLMPYARNARRDSAAQIGRIATSIVKLGFVNPLLIDEHGAVLAGYGRLAAAKRLGMTYVPTIEITHLTSAQKNALALALNNVAENVS